MAHCVPIIYLANDLEQNDEQLISCVVGILGTLALTLNQYNTLLDKQYSIDNSIKSSRIPLYYTILVKKG